MTGFRIESARRGSMLAQFARILELGLIRVITPEIQPLRHVIERPAQRDFGYQCPAGVMITGVRRDTTQDRRPHDSVVIVAPEVEQDAPEAIGRPSLRGQQRVLRSINKFVVAINPSRPRMRQHDLWISIKRFHAQLQKISGVEIVVRRPLEQFAAGFVQRKIVIRRETDVVWLSEISDSRVLLRVLTADITGLVSRRVIRDNELEIFEALTE